MIIQQKYTELTSRKTTTHIQTIYNTSNNKKQHSNLDK